MFAACSKELWDGHVAIQFELAETDITAAQVPAPVFLLCSRLSYLPVVASDIVKNFQQSAIEFSSHAWFEYAGTPLKSNLPIGVLSDVHRETSDRVDCSEPWRVIIHFQNFPAQLLLPGCDESTSEKYFFHSLKQALFLLGGNTHAFNELGIEAQRKLWEGVYAGDRRLYEEVASKFLPASLLNVDSAESEAQSLKCIPMRIVQRSGAISQRPIGFVSQSFGGNPTTLRDFLSEEFQGLDIDGTAVLIQGIAAPLDVPLRDIWSLMCHGDLFLYVALPT
ncbi:autophagy protein Apg5-domain-containing protein [Ochromonadaceae sp. CCMP2298]|nr:autophagy protein Apg5-domain-containing protein [Ochromonadaceae sp. CCMP2298]